MANDWVMKRDYVAFFSFLSIEVLASFYDDG